MATTAPRAGPSNAKPSDPADRCSGSLTAWMRAAQLAEIAPRAKNPHHHPGSGRQVLTVPPGPVVRSDREELNAFTPKRSGDLLGDRPVGDQHVNLGSRADHRHRRELLQF